MDQHKLLARSIPAAVRARILHPEAECHYCGSRRSLVVEHYVPVAGGGTRDEDNLVAACGRCNGEKADRTPSQWREYRISKRRPWPPPCLDDLPSLALTDLPVAYRDLAIRALRAQDAQLSFELDSIADRAWVGADDRDHDQRCLMKCLDGVEVRIARARKHEFRVLAKIVKDHHRDRLALEERALADIMKVRPQQFRLDAKRFQRDLAEQVARISERFFSNEEQHRLTSLVNEATEWAARRQRVVRESRALLDEIQGIEGGPLSPTMTRIARARIGTFVGQFVEGCDEAQLDELRALMGEFAGRSLALF